MSGYVVVLQVNDVTNSTLVDTFLNSGGYRLFRCDFLTVTS